MNFHAKNCQFSIIVHKFRIFLKIEFLDKIWTFGIVCWAEWIKVLELYAICDYTWSIMRLGRWPKHKYKRKKGCECRFGIWEHAHLGMHWKGTPIVARRWKCWRRSAKWREREASSKRWLTRELLPRWFSLNAHCGLRRGHFASNPPTTWCREKLKKFKISQKVTIYSFASEAS